ncbi:cryptochrome/photolyase family protein [Flavobacterium sp.]|jgi:deoxyribodipyrimidine photolyase-related protein|uniref:cryptochrome/photolyase family protein n=1 Tax=Flavobacterium sp. TaxID=239 RepID=UPI0037BE67AB
MKKLRLVLGDQLNHEHSWFDEKNPDILYVMAEMRQETDYVKHHIQKVVAFFQSMRNFSEYLKENGHEVRYCKISDKDNPNELTALLSNLISKEKIECFEYQLPDEYRLDVQLKDFCESLKIDFKAFDSEHFYTSRTELSEFFEGKKMLLMENFYRMMRKKHHVLMQGSQPEGNLWNFDKDNRLKYKGQVPIPVAIGFQQNINEILSEIEKANVATFGKIDSKNFNWPTSRKACLAQLTYFCENLLKHFGDFEDAMHTDEKFLFHSRLSFAMNSKMLSPKEVVDTVVDFYYENTEEISISQVEGFVRQILGWREYVRGIYWKEMPNYAQMNALENHHKLPDFYWTGKTKMNCMQKAITQSLEEAYAHHIQRLMIIGNFSLLMQMHPDEVDAWYLGVYIDAIEWVEMPNTRGMSQYADGGILATKPYVSSGSYINKMSNYCGSCHYNVKDKLGEKACPFNSLYWHFLDEKKDYFANSQRMAMMMSLLKKMKPAELAATKEKAISLMENRENL